MRWRAWRATSASPRCCSSTSRSPPRSITSNRCSRSRPCWWPTSAAARRTSASCASARSAARRIDRRDDILANHGVHVAGTDFDRRIELQLHPAAGGPWHLRAAARRRRRAARGAERHLLRSRHLAPDQHLLHAGAGARVARHARLVRRRAAACATDDHPQRAPRPRAGRARRRREDRGVGACRPRRSIWASSKPGLATLLREPQAMQAIAADRERIVGAAREALRQAGLTPDAARRDVLHRRLHRPAAAGGGDCGGGARARRSCEATASPAWPPVWACTRGGVFEGAAA